MSLTEPICSARWRCGYFVSIFPRGRDGGATVAIAIVFFPFICRSFEYIYQSRCSWWSMHKTKERSAKEQRQPHLMPRWLTRSENSIHQAATALCLTVRSACRRYIRHLYILSVSVTSAITCPFAFQTAKCRHGTFACAKGSPLLHSSTLNLNTT